MNLEQIDTSTTAGRAEVMRLAAEGRRVVWRPKDQSASEPVGWSPITRNYSAWDWGVNQYAVIKEHSAPIELWVAVNSQGVAAGLTHMPAQAMDLADEIGGSAVRYIRADLAGEKG